MRNDTEVTGAPVAAIVRLQLFKASEVFISEQANALTRFRPVLIGRDCVGAPKNDFEYRVMAPARRPLRAIRAGFGTDSFFRSALADYKPSVVHAHFGIDAVAVMNSAQSLDLPLVTTFHGFDATTRFDRLLRSGSPSLIRYALGRNRLSRQGDLFICVSEFIRKKVLELGFPENKVVRHYIGTDVARFDTVSAERNEGVPIVLHVARLVEKKGTAYLLAAFARVRRQCPDSRLVVIGEGPLRAQLEAQIDDLGLGDSVEMLGACSHDEVLQWLKRASIFALPSVTASDGDTEGLPISIIEAAAAGLPIISTWHSGIPEAVQDGVGGVLVSERDTAALADALRLLLLDPQTRTRMGTSAQQFIRENFDIRTQTKKLEELYGRIK